MEAASLHSPDEALYLQPWLIVQSRWELVEINNGVNYWYVLFFLPLSARLKISRFSICCQVFSFLGHAHLCIAAMVCKQWRAASAHEDFWRSLDFENRNISVVQREFFFLQKSIICFQVIYMFIWLQIWHFRCSRIDIDYPLYLVLNFLGDIVISSKNILARIDKWQCNRLVMAVLFNWIVRLFYKRDSKTSLFWLLFLQCL